MLAWFGSTPPLWVQVAIASLWVGGVILLAEVLSHSSHVSSESVRKIVHIGTGNVILLAWWLQIPTWLGVSASALFSLVALLSYRLPILPGINSVGRKSLGTFFYAVSFGVLIAWFWDTQPHYAIVGILVMTWGDGLAALVGKKWGKHPYQLWGIEKSWEGSGTMLLVSYGVCFCVLLAASVDSSTAVAALGVAIAATSLEAFSKYGIDNLTVPLGSAFVALLLTQ